MAVIFSAVGALAADASTTNLAITAPACAANDILIAAIQGKDNQVITAPAGWTKFVELNNTTGQRITLAWKRAALADSGAVFTFTKPVDNDLLFCGVISAWSGCLDRECPIDTATPTTMVAATANETVSYASFTPEQSDAHVVAIGFYADDLTTAGAIAGTDPSFANHWDLETSTGTDASIFGYSGASSGAATGARSHVSASTADAINVGVLFGLVERADVVWPYDTLQPNDFDADINPASISGGRSISGGEQVLQSDAGFWQITLGPVPIRDNDQVLAWREVETLLDGRAGSLQLPLYDGKRAPWAPGSIGGTITASASGAIARGATSGSIKMTVGSALRPGMIFSALERAYRIKSVGTPAGSPAVYPVTFLPPVREKINDADTLEFRRPVCRVRQAADDGMRAALKLMRSADPSVDFVEDV